MRNTHGGGLRNRKRGSSRSTMEAWSTTLALLAASVGITLDLHSRDRPGNAHPPAIYFRPFPGQSALKTQMHVPRTRSTVLLIAALACLCQTGCVQRRLTVRSNPP